MKRISQKVFDECNSLEDLVNKMNTLVDGTKINRVGEYRDFKNRLDLFKETINKIFPALSVEDILFIDNHYMKMKELYNWYNSEDLLAALEFELEKVKLKNG